MTSPGEYPQLVAVLGAGVLAQDEPVATADDLGLTRGDGCFDATLVTVEGGRARVLHLDRHLARLERSAQALGLSAPQAGAWQALVQEATAEWVRRRQGEAMLKLVLTRGREVEPGEPLGYVTLTPIDRQIRQNRQGLRVVTLSTGRASDAFADAPWLLGGVKTISYAVNLAAGREARSRGADDALFTSTDGYALEGPTSSLCVYDGNTFSTTPAGATGILTSITQTTLFAGLQAAGERVAERLITVEEVRGARAAWLLSSVRGVAPIVHLDDATVRTDAALTARLVELGGFPAHG